MKITKKQAIKNKKAVREYWRSYLNDGHIMGWLFADDNGDLWGEYEPQGQTYKVHGDDRRIVHQFGDFYRAHGEMPKRIALKDFISELSVSDYLDFWKIEVRGSALAAAKRYMQKYFCNQDGTNYSLSMFSVDDQGHEWAELKSYNGYKLLFVSLN